MPTTFGVPGEQQAFTDRNARFLEVLPLLVRQTNEVLASRSFAPTARAEGESEGDYEQRVIAERLVFFLGRLAAEDFMEILLLGANGYGMAGLKLLRSMFEGVVTSLYIARHADQAKMFMGYHVVHQRKPLNAAKAAGLDWSPIVPDAAQAEIETRYQATKDSYRQSKCPECDVVIGDVSWTKMDPIAMARELNLQELAVQCYSFATLQIHTTPTRLFSRLEDTADSIRFKEGPQRAEVDAAMVGAHLCLALVLCDQNRYFNLRIASLEEAAVTAAIERAWGLGLTAIGGCAMIAAIYAHRVRST